MINRIHSRRCFELPSSVTGNHGDGRPPQRIHSKPNWALRNRDKRREHGFGAGDFDRIG
jgi:hypothetical protein